MNVLWQKKSGFLVAVFTALCTHCAVWQKIVPVLNIILRVKIIVHFLSCILHFDKGRRSCPGASCKVLNRISYGGLDQVNILFQLNLLEVRINQILLI